LKEQELPAFKFVVVDRITTHLFIKTLSQRQASNGTEHEFD